MENFDATLRYDHIRWLPRKLASNRYQYIYILSISYIYIMEPKQSTTKEEPNDRIT